MGVVHVRRLLTVISFIFMLAFTVARRDLKRLRNGRCLGEVMPSCCRTCVCNQEGWICDSTSCWGCDSNTVYFKATRGPRVADNGKCVVGSAWSTGRCGEMCFCEEKQVEHCALTPCVILDRDRDGKVFFREVDNSVPFVHPTFRNVREVNQIEENEGDDDEEDMAGKKSP